MAGKRQEALNGLTIKEEKACQLYVFGGKETSGNAYASYNSVYNFKTKNLTKETIYTKAHHFFNQPHVAKRVNELLKQYADAITPELIKQRIKEISDGAPKESDKLRGYELLGKTHALFVEKQLIDVDVSGFVVEDDIAEPPTP